MVEFSITFSLPDRWKVFVVYIFRSFLDLSPRNSCFFMVVSSILSRIELSYLVQSWTRSVYINIVLSLSLTAMFSSRSSFLSYICIYISMTLIRNTIQIYILKSILFVFRSQNILFEINWYYKPTFTYRYK